MRKTKYWRIFDIILQLYSVQISRCRSLFHTGGYLHSTKYIKLPGIRDLHEFVVVTSPNTGNATMLVRKGCYGGTSEKSPLKLNLNYTAEFNVFPSENDTYSQLKKTRELTETTLTHLTQMCQNFIPEERWMDCMTRSNTSNWFFTLYSALAVYSMQNRLCLLGCVRVKLE